MTKGISDDLDIYTSYVRVAEAHLALAKEISLKDRNNYDLMKDKMQKWIYKILDIFENQMLRKGKNYYVDIVRVLKDDIVGRFKEIDNLEGSVK